MPSTRDPHQMTDDQRIQEVASLLATAIRRVQDQPTPATSSSEKTPDSSARALEVSTSTRLTVTIG